MFRHLKLSARWMAIAVAIGVCCSSQALAKKPEKPAGEGYTLVLLPDVAGNTQLDGCANAMNEMLIEGQLEAVEVVGSLAGRAHHWWLDSEGNVVTTTPLLPTGQFTEAHDINDNGIIVGGGDISGAVLPLAWSSLDDQPIELPVPAGVTGMAVNINNFGIVVGCLQDVATSIEMIVVWQLIEGENGPTFVEPYVLVEAPSVREPDLNDAGEVIGTVKVGGTYHGQRWSVSRDGQQLTASQAETLTGEMPDENGQLQTVNLRCRAINEAGDTCGDYAAAEGPWGAFLLLADGTLIDLPPLESKRYITQSGLAWDLNDAVDPSSIQLVGLVDIFDKRGWYLDGYPVVWQSGSVLDLEAETEQPDSDLRLVEIDCISNQGWLAGHAGDIIAPRAAVIVYK